MPSSGGRFEQGYIAQAGVDVETQLIVAQDVTEHTNDKQEVEPALESLTKLPKALGKAHYVKRTSTVEAVFSLIKHVFGFRQFLLARAGVSPE